MRGQGQQVLPGTPGMRGWIGCHLEFEAWVPERLRLADVTAIHHAPVQKVGHRVYLLPRAPTMGTGQGPDKLHAPVLGAVPGVELVLLGDQDGVAGQVTEGGVTRLTVQLFIIGALFKFIKKCFLYYCTVLCTVITLYCGEWAKS